MRALAVALLLLAPTAAGAAAACPPAGHDRQTLSALKASGFSVADDPARAALALALLDCLEDSDPALRDGVAFEGLSHWMRQGQLSPATVAEIGERLRQRLGAPDPQGFAHPFAALVLAEVARTERIEPWMDAEQRAQMVDAAAAYLKGVRDYRGFIDGEGWRHGVAHGADWVLQLVLNPAIDTDHLAQLREAIGAQVLAAGGHAYVFNEPARLATPLLFIARRGVFDGADWEAWLLQLPPRIGPAEAVWSSADALAARHNLQALLLVLHFEASRSEDPGVQALLPGVLAALRALP